MKYFKIKEVKGTLVFLLLLFGGLTTYVIMFNIFTDFKLNPLDAILKAANTLSLSLSFSMFGFFILAFRMKTIQEKIFSLIVSIVSCVWLIHDLRTMVQIW